MTEVAEVAEVVGLKYCLSMPSPLGHGLAALAAGWAIAGPETARAGRLRQATIFVAVGLAPDVQGMHGPEARIEELPLIFRGKENGGILGREGVVDYVTGPDLSGGLFIVVYNDDKRIRSDLSYLKIGEGPYYAFYQRFHNWFLDMPLSIARAAILKEPTLVPLPEPSCSVVALAKRSLKPGEKLDGIGGFCCYGQLRSAADAKGLLPHGLSDCARTRNELAAGQPLGIEDIELDESAELVRLWRSQVSAG